MSGSDPPDVHTTQSLKRKTFSKDDQDELEELDKRIKRIRAVVPHNPYILSTPSMDPYRYHSQQEANAWMLGHLWKHDEEHMQYRTYLYREPCQDCFELQAGEDDEPEPERERPQSQASRASNTTSQGPKKKISLSAYKSKQANGVITPTPGSKLASPNLPPSNPPAAQTNGAKKPEKQAAPAQKPAEPKPHKEYVNATARHNSANLLQARYRRRQKKHTRERHTSRQTTPATSTSTCRRDQAYGRRGRKDRRQIESLKFHAPWFTSNVVASTRATE